MSKGRDKVKEEIDNRLRGFIISYNQAEDSYQQLLIVEKYRNYILSIPELAVVDRNAELPDNPFTYPHPMVRVSEQRAAYMRAQQDMLKAGWVKEVKDEI